MSLVWSCLVTLFLCSWTAVHPNVWGRVSLWRRALKRTYYMFLALMFPEVVIGVALLQLLEARELSKRMKYWSLPVSFYVLCDGLRFRGTDGDQIFLGADELPNVEGEYGIQIDIAMDDIQDRSNADEISKTVVCFQISWLFIQTITRYAQGLVVTPLELFTFATIISSVVVYVLWWYKPQDISTRTIIDLPDTSENILEKIGGVRLDANERLGYFHAENPRAIPMLDVLTPASIVFGIVESLALCTFFSILRYPEVFPTRSEKIVWIAGVGVQAFMSLAVLITMFAMGRYREDKSFNITLNIMLAVFVFYVLCRFGLLILAFTSLRSLPASAYQTVYWENFIPHI
ncbi:hypothetical protein ABW19_dt0201742 [Dactylella cylindrospora]|nr:hypothetical protein ABW19_dt0201742 [Dactylella cylindrospora]